MPGSLPPGWYPAPGSPNALRWWDGIRWTGEVRETDGAGDAATPAPAFGADPATAEGRATGQAPAGEQGDAPGAPAAWRAPAMEAWQARTEPEPPRRLRRWRGQGRRSGGAR